MRTIHRDIAVAFIFSDDNKLLLGKSTRGSYEGCWVVPGGGIESGESELQAVIREVREETGLDISDEKITRADIEVSGTSRKILDSGEEVNGEYDFFAFVVHLSSSSKDVAIDCKDDFVDGTWFSTPQLKTIKLPEPSIEFLKGLGVL